MDLCAPSIIAQNCSFRLNSYIATIYPKMKFCYAYPERIQAQFAFISNLQARSGVVHQVQNKNPISTDLEGITFLATYFEVFLPGTIRTIVSPFDIGKVYFTSFKTYKA